MPDVPQRSSYADGPPARGADDPAAALPEAVVSAFAARYGAAPELVVRAPGRVNLIGEHTDYNDGFVLPMAIDRAAWIALRPRADATVWLHSLEYGGTTSFRTDALQRSGEGWAEYVKGVAWALGEAGHTLRGWEGVMAGDVPIGAGLSSSAALELAAARAFAATSGLPWQPVEMASLCQRAENEWVGVNCGIMDQMISAVGREGHAVLIDCRTLETRPVPLPPDTVVVIMDTTTRRGLVDSAYNERRRQCEHAARIFGVPALRDVTPRHLEARAGELDPVTARRARHVVTENERTRAAAAAMSAGDAPALGALMNASHASLRDDYEVSIPELDLMVSLAQARSGCHGARMTGAGFGGCAVALVERETVGAFVEQVAAAYRDGSGRQPQLYVTEAADGASIHADRRPASRAG